MINIPEFHPSLFETTAEDVPYDQRKIMEQTVSDKSLGELSPAQKYQLTVDDKQLSGSNTRYLFRDLYGETLLTFLFFSKDNVENIQNVARFITYKQTGYIIDNQSINELLIVMRSIFLEYSAHPKLIDESMPDTEKKQLIVMYTNEVARLNDLVINAIVPKIISQMIQYINYLKDASTQPYHMDRPKNVNVAGERVYRSVTEVLTGSNL